MSDAVVRATSHQTILDCFEERVTPNPLGISLEQLDDVGITTTALPPSKNGGKHLQVYSRLYVGIDQRLRLGWIAPIDMLQSGWRVMAFRRTDGFSPAKHPENLSTYGQKILDTEGSDMKDEWLTPGEYFYTFILFKPGLFINRFADVIEFQERIPTGEQVIARLREAAEGQKLVQELLRMHGVPSKSVHSQPKTDQVFGGKKVAELLAEQRREIDALRESEDFKTLPEKEQQFAIDCIKSQYRSKMM